MSNRSRCLSAVSHNLSQPTAIVLLDSAKPHRCSKCGPARTQGAAMRHYAPATVEVVLAKQSTDAFAASPAGGRAEPGVGGCG